MGLHYYGLRATNPGYTVNFLNVVPVVTCIIAVILRVEKLKIGTWPGQLKVLGTAICVGGTMVISLYKGKLLHLWPIHLLKSQLQASGATSSIPDHHNMLIGTLFLAGSSLSYAFWFIIQVRVSKEFPSKYFSTMLACVSGTVQAVVIGVILNRDPSAWAVKWDLQLLTIVYSGVFNTGVTFCLISWAVARRHRKSNHHRKSDSFISLHTGLIELKVTILLNVSGHTCGMLWCNLSKTALSLDLFSGSL